MVWTETNAKENNEPLTMHRDYGQSMDSFYETILEINSTPVEVLGYSYENTFEIPNGKYGKDSINSVLLSKS